VVTGTADVEPGAKPSQQRGYLEKYEESYTGIGLDTAGFDEAYSVRIRITPTRSWAF
jgi:hypothetical protein